MYDYVLALILSFTMTEPGTAPDPELVAEVITQEASANPLLNSPLETAVTLIVNAWHESRLRPIMASE